jgi:hypothetical protein
VGGQTTEFLNFAAGDACNSQGFKTIWGFFRVFCSAGSEKITYLMNTEKIRTLQKASIACAIIMTDTVAALPMTSTNNETYIQKLLP